MQFITPNINGCVTKHCSSLMVQYYCRCSRTMYILSNTCNSDIIDSKISILMESVNVGFSQIWSQIKVKLPHSAVHVSSPTRAGCAGFETRSSTSTAATTDSSTSSSASRIGSAGKRRRLENSI